MAKSLKIPKGGNQEGVNRRTDNTMVVVGRVLCGRGMGFFQKNNYVAKFYRKYNSR
jgi:hypothetical protein